MEHPSVRPPDNRTAERDDVSKYIAIDLEPDGIFVVAGSARGGHVKIEQALSWTEADGEAPPTLAGDTAKRIGEQLRDKLKAAGVANAPVLISVGRGRVILKELRYPAVPATEEPALVRFQAMKELSDATDEVVLDYTPLSNGAPEGERRSMAVVIRKDLFAAIQQMCAAANLKTWPRYAPSLRHRRRADPRVRLGRGEPRRRRRPTRSPRSSSAPAGGEFTVVRDGEVTFTRDVPGPVATSEPMLIGEVRRNLTMYAGGTPGHPVQGLYVAEAAGGWAGRLRAALGLPVHAYDPLSGSVPDVPEPLAAGSPVRPACSPPSPPGPSRSTSRTPRQPVIDKDPKQKQMLIAAVAVVVFLLGGARYGYLTLSAADTSFTRLQEEKSDLENQVKKLEPDAKRLDAATKWKPGRSTGSTKPSTPRTASRRRPRSSDRRTSSSPLAWTATRYRRTRRPASRPARQSWTSKSPPAVWLR